MTHIICLFHILSIGDFSGVAHASFFKGNGGLMAGSIQSKRTVYSAYETKIKFVLFKRTLFWSACFVFEIFQFV